MHIPGDGTGIGRTTRLLLIAATVLAVLHHIDHILRVDHSGWPFRQKVTPFTFSLIAYPILFFALLGPARFFWVRWVLMVAGTGFTIFAHSWIESPQMQYAMWAYNRSLEPQLWDVRNLCGVESGALGVAAVLLSMLLNATLVAACVAMVADGRRRRA